MSLIAVGTYLRHLREARGITRAELARRVVTDERQLARIERGEVDTRASLLAAVCDEVEGNPRDLHRLLRDEQATEEQGRQLAELQITRLREQVASKLVDQDDEFLKELTDAWGQHVARFLADRLLSIARPTEKPQEEGSGT